MDKEDKIQILAYETRREEYRRALLDNLPDQSMTAVLERLWLLWES